MSKTVDLGRRPRYPITIVKLLKPAGSTIEKQETLLQYSYRWKRTVGNHIKGETWEEEVTSIADWDSPVEGELLKWHIKEGDSITRDQKCLDVKEPCSHEIQFQGLCAICGKDMTVMNWATETRDTERAPINMVHDNTSLTVSQSRAQHAESELRRRLISQRKLTLVVDLDQTIIHACIDPTIGEWQRDPSNPNHAAVKDVRSFQLNDDGPRGVANGCWYYIKLRPGLEEFLQHVKDKFELHVYTMGTRAYALNIAKLVDPEQKLFGNRVISRDENGSMTAKSLQRLFPTSTNMVVIIDDRADVWPRNRRNLIKVQPYDFFKGIGDINSSFLPKREDLLPSPSTDDESTKKNGEVPNGKELATAKETSPDGKASPLDLTTFSGSDDVAAKEHEKTLEHQLKDRPLQHLQEELDKEEEEAEKQEANGQDTPHTEEHHNRPALYDDDHELGYLEQHLNQLHEAYFEEYDASHPDSGASKQNNGNVDLSTVPDVGDVLDSLKTQALSGTKIVLSGILPTGIDIVNSELGLQLRSFGAEVRIDVTKDITHVVVSPARPRTQKVQQAAKYPHIKIVTHDWMAECLTQWTLVDETPYEVEIHPSDRINGASPEDTEEEYGGEEADGDDSKPRGKIVRGEGLKLKIVQEPNGDDAEEEAPGLNEEQGTPITDLKEIDWGEMGDFLSEEEDAQPGDGDGNDNEDGDDEDEDEGDDDDEPAEDEDQPAVDEDGPENSEEPRPTPSRKRKHDDDDAASESEAGSGGVEGLPKKRLARSRGFSSLRAQFNSDSNLPTPQTGDEKPETDANDGDEEDGGDEENGIVDFNIDDLEAELEEELAEMEEAENGHHEED